MTTWTCYFWSVLKLASAQFQLHNSVHKKIIIPSTCGESEGWSDEVGGMVDSWTLCCNGREQLFTRAHAEGTKGDHGVIKAALHRLTWTNSWSEWVTKAARLLHSHAATATATEWEAPTASYWWTSEVWEITGWSSRLQEKYPSFLEESMEYASN